ncbi:MAG: response regulator [Bacteroidetes bacterium]|nr:response regulator [Bacteroidota bacterium]
MKYRIGILDDHPVVVKGLQDVLLKHGHQVVWTSNSVTDAMAKSAIQVDIIFSDIQLPDGDGIHYCKEILSVNKHVKVIGFSSFSDGSFIRNMIRNGAVGYLLKESDESLVLESIEKVMAGEQVIDPKIKEVFLETQLGIKKNDVSLTRRESEILKLIADGLSTKEIADRLFLSIKTVEAHRSNLMLKMDAKNMAHLIAVAFDRGLI